MIVTITWTKGQHEIVLAITRQLLVRIIIDI